MSTSLHKRNIDVFYDTDVWFYLWWYSPLQIHHLTTIHTLCIFSVVFNALIFYAYIKATSCGVCGCCRALKRWAMFALTVKPLCVWLWCIFWMSVCFTRISFYYVHIINRVLTLNRTQPCKLPFSGAIMHGKIC